ncbi:hypothetical protein GIB67_039240, partial [Kingdonia uniflora]
MSSTASTATANEKKKDEGWEYGEARDPANRNTVWCKLCNKKCTVGISRLKEHLIGGYPSVTKCPNVPVEVSKKFKDMVDKVKNDKKEKKRLEEEKRKRAQDVDEESGEEEDCSGGITSRHKRGKTKVKGSLDCIYEPTNKGQRKIENNFEKKCRAKAISAIATWFYDNGLLRSSSARRNMSKMIPGEWWMTYGSDAPELQKVAIRILSQTCSASPCERNWGFFSNVHTKKRNKLDSAKLNDLVFVMYNRKLEIRYKRRQTELGSKEDPILLRDVEDCNEWVTFEVLPEYVHPGEDLTYEQVEAAVLGDDVGPSTRSRTTETRGEQSQPRGVIEGFIDEIEPRHRVSRR